MLQRKRQYEPSRPPCSVESLEERLLLSTLNYDWQRVEIGPSGHFDGVVVHPTDPDVVYARSDVGGAYRLDRATGQWEALLDWINPDQTQNLYGSAGLGLDPNNSAVLYAAVGRYTSTAGAGLYKSTDFGETFSMVLNVPLASNTDYREYGEPIAVDPNNSNIVYYGSQTQGVWRTTTGGNSQGDWAQVSTASVPAGEVRCVAIDGTLASGGVSQRIYVAVQDPNPDDAVVVAEGVYASTDGGTTWARITNSPSRVSRLQVAADGRVYMSSCEGTRYGVFRYNASTQTLDTITPPVYNVLPNVQLNDFAYLNTDENTTPGRKITQLPSVLAGTTMIQPSPSASDRELPETTTNITLQTQEALTLYIAYIQGLTLPSWMAGWTQVSGAVVKVDSFAMNVYSKTFAAGQTVQLGGNNGTTGSHLHYLTFAKPDDGTGQGAELLNIQSTALYNNFRSVAVDPTNANRLIASVGIYNELVFITRSSDAGQTWETLRVKNTESNWRIGSLHSWNEPKYTLAIDPHNPGQAFAGDVFGLWEFGDIWNSSGIRADIVTADVAGTGLNNNAALGIVAPSGGTAQVFTFMADVGGFRNTSLTTAPSSRLNITPSGYSLRNITDMDVSITDPNVVLANVVNVQDINTGVSGQVHASYDNGVTFTKVTSPASAAGTVGSPRIMISAGGDMTGSGGLDYRKNWVYVPGNNEAPEYTTDGGATWHATTGIGTGVQPSIDKYTRMWICDSDKVTPGTFYIWHNTQKKLYRSTDSGATWTAIATLTATADSGVSPHVRAVPGQAGEVWLALGAGGLWRYQQSTGTATLVNGWDDVASVAFGASETPGGPATLFVHGRRAGEWGFFRSTDMGATFTRFSVDAVRGYSREYQMEADPRVFGRIYVAQPGSGYVYNIEDSSCAAPDATPQVVAAWNFNDYVAGGAAIAATVGAGSINLSNFSSAGRTAPTGYSNNAFAGEVIGKALGLKNNVNNNHYIDISMSMEGLQDLKVSYGYRGFNGHFATQVWSYSTDGVNFSPLTTRTETETTKTVTLDFSQAIGLNNTSSITLRLTLSGATSSSSESRFENLHFIATPISETTAFTDDFNRSDSTTIGNNWVETSTANINASITGNQLVFTGVGATAGSRSSVAQPLSNMPGLSGTLSQNSGLVTWRFNIRHDSEAGGLNSGRTGGAFVLAADASNFYAGQGADGYAVVIPQANRGAVVSTADPLRLVRFADGVNKESSNIATYTPLITASSGVFADVGTEYLSVAVTYDPATHAWSLYARNDGSGFLDPADETTAYTLIGTAVDSTYTSTAMTHLGAFVNNNGNGSPAIRYDNVQVILGGNGPEMQMMMAGGNLWAESDSSTPSASSSSVEASWTPEAQSAPTTPPTATLSEWAPMAATETITPSDPEGTINGPEAAPEESDDLLASLSPVLTV